MVVDSAGTHWHRAGRGACFYLRSPQIFTLTCFLALGTARFDFENNLFGALKMRTAYQFFTKTFSQNAASGKDEKRRKKKLRRLMKSKLPMQELLQFRFGETVSMVVKTARSYSVSTVITRPTLTS